MSEAIKFTEEELKTVEKVQKEYIDVQNQFGQISVSRLRIEEQLTKIDDSEVEIREKFLQIQEEERNFLKDITEKYGEGTLNPETGVFTPNKSQ